VRDVTERRRNERQSAALAAIVESSDDAITTIAPDLRITYWNRGAERMFGFTAAESIDSRSRGTSRPRVMRKRGKSLSA